MAEIILLSELPRVMAGRVVDAGTLQPVKGASVRAETGDVDDDVARIADLHFDLSRAAAFDRDEKNEHNNSGVCWLWQPLIARY
jgi:hypothetical protein